MSNQIDELPIEKVRDAVMLYLTQILKLENYELAFMSNLIYSKTFIMALTYIRIKMDLEDFRFYSLDALKGLKPQPGEDEETLGHKLVEWVDNELEEYRKPPGDLSEDFPGLH